MKIKISKSNSKLGLIPSVSLPPILTCRQACPCQTDCYALKGRYRFQNVKNNLSSNLELYITSPDQYFNEIKEAIDGGIVRYSYFRWHAAGDIVDEDYFIRMVKLAEELPHVNFLAFTKKYELVNNFIRVNGDLPENLNLVFSAWGNMLDVDNPFDLPVAYVRFKDKNKNGFIPETALGCSGNCTSCLQCWSIKKKQSVVFDKH